VCAAEWLAPRSALVGVGGRAPEQFRISGSDQGIEPGVDGVDAGQVGVEDLSAGDRTRRHQADELVGGQLTEVGHVAMVIRKGRDFLGFSEELAP
jgi:hypothetical protein